MPGARRWANLSDLVSVHKSPVFQLHRLSEDAANLDGGLAAVEALRASGCARSTTRTTDAELSRLRDKLDGHCWMQLVKRLIWPQKHQQDQTRAIDSRSPVRPTAVRGLARF